MPPSNAKDSQSGLDTRASDPVLGTDNRTETLSDGAYRTSKFQGRTDTVLADRVAPGQRNRGDTPHQMRGESPYLTILLGRYRVTP